MLKEMAEKGERDKGKGGDRKSQFHEGTVKLPDIGISRKQSSNWQKIAEIRMGELIKGLPRERIKEGSTQRTSLSSLPEGISKKQSHYARQLADNKDGVIL